MPSSTKQIKWKESISDRKPREGHKCRVLKNRIRKKRIKEREIKRGLWMSSSTKQKKVEEKDKRKTWVNVKRRLK